MTLRYYVLLISVIFTNLLFSQQNDYNRISLDMDWKFQKGGAYGAQRPTFDDSNWRNIDVPHDWSIENLEGTNSPFNAKATSQVNGGFTTGGTAWYRKTFKINKEASNKISIIQFDGVYMNSEIYVNGHKVGIQPYGYSTFQFNITPYLVYDKQNIIAVKVKNLGENSRWYSGSGIYRHVWLIHKNKTHIKPWGVFVNTPKINKAEAQVSLEIDVNTEDSEDYKISTVIIDANNKEVASLETNSSAAKNGINYQNLIIKKPLLWSLKETHQYVATTELKVNNKVVDRVKTKFGVRSLTFDVNNGFQLNGEKVLLKGGCIHHDNGPLGAKSFDRAEERKIELLKASGFNAIRTSHNPPSQKLLEVCDRLGMLVIDEAFDAWSEAKNPEDYHLYFNDWWKKDVKNMILRDRNHPSIILWSTGNEIPERGRPKGVKISKMISDYMKSLDPTRPITSAVNGLSLDKDPYFNTLDISGYNYAVGGDHNKKNIYSADHQRVPNRIMYGSESYPIEAFGNWMEVLEYPYVIGDFVWTAWDYIGEAGIGWMGYPQKSNFYPWTLAYNGDFDICGWKRPQSYYRDVLWKENQLSVFVKSPTPSFPDYNKDLADWSKWNWDDVVEHWNWSGYEGKPLEVDVYASCPVVELFLNDKSLGKKTIDKNSEYRTTFSVPYASGTLKAVGYNKNKKVKTVTLKTATEPISIKATPDRNTIKASGVDLSYVTIELVDKNGTRNFVEDEELNFEIEGPGEIIAVANANPRSTESYTDHKRKTWRGRCMVIIKSTKERGTIKLIINSNKIKSTQTIITVI